MKKLSKTEAKEQIQEFFKDIKNKTPKEVQKIKKVAMGHNIPLKTFRKKFCKKCFSPYKNSKVRIKENSKLIVCEYCEYVNKWKIKTF